MSAVLQRTERARGAWLRAKSRSNVWTCPRLASRPQTTMPTASTELLTIPSDFPSSSTQVYRIWLMTDSADPPGQKGDVSLCLHGALGSVWLQQLQTMTPSAQGAATVYGCKIDKDGRPAGGGGKCELYVSEERDGGCEEAQAGRRHAAQGDGRVWLRSGQGQGQPAVERWRRSSCATAATASSSSSRARRPR